MWSLFEGLLFQSQTAHLPTHSLMSKTIGPSSSTVQSMCVKWQTLKWSHCWDLSRRRLFHVCVCVCVCVIGSLKEHLVCKKCEWCGAGIFICLQWVADDLHMVSRCHCHPISCFIKIQNGLLLLCRLTQVVCEKRPLNGSSSSSCSRSHNCKTAKIKILSVNSKQRT